MPGMSDFPPALPDFSRPLDALKACHARIRSHCEMLRRLVEHVGARGGDEQARRSAAVVMRYFDTAARLHHEDEEEDLLPRMMSAATLSRGSRLTRLLADIANEHRDMERLWIDLRPVLQELSAGESVRLDELLVDRFGKLYHMHMALEESNVLPLAEMLLSQDDLAEIGAGMRQRRAIGG